MAYRPTILSDVHELKQALSIDQDNTIEDTLLMFQIEWASGLIEDYLDRRLGIDTTTEYYQGTDTQRIQLRRRPATPADMSVWVQQDGFFGAASGSFDSGSLLVYGVDYVLDVDQPDGTSRSGILIRTRTTWPRMWIRVPGLLSPFRYPTYGSVKVTYTAGYTVDTMPAPVRLACNLLVMKMRNLMPLGQEVGSESYEERHISYATRNKDYLMSLVKPILHTYRNWSF